MTRWEGYISIHSKGRLDLALKGKTHQLKKWELKGGGGEEKLRTIEKGYIARLKKGDEKKASADIPRNGKRKATDQTLPHETDRYN